MMTVSGTGASVQMLSGLTLQGSTLSVTGNAAVEVGRVGVTTKNAVTVDAGNTMSGNGTVAAAVIDNGTVSALGGTLSVTGKLSGSGTAIIGDGATMNSQGSLGVANVSFAAGSQAQTLVLGTTAGDIAVISGFRTGDTIDVQHVTAASLSFLGGKLKLMDGSGAKILTLSLSGNYTTANFALSSDGHGGTDVSAAGLGAQMAMLMPSKPLVNHSGLSMRRSHGRTAAQGVGCCITPRASPHPFALFDHGH